MALQKANFSTKWYNQANNLIEMKDWIDTTLSNQGTSTAIVNGQTLLPGETFVVNGSTTLINGFIELKFKDPKDKINSVAVNFNRLIKNCN